MKKEVPAQNTPVIKAVIFDMDGVIIDSEPVWKEIEQGFYEQLGINLSPEKLKTSIGRSAIEWWSEIIEEYNLDADAQELAEFETLCYRDFLDDDERRKPIMPEITEALKHLSSMGIRIGVASGSPTEVIPRVLKLADPDGSIDAWISAENDTIQNGKPAPDIFLQAASMLAANPENCLVVEDSYNGLLAAKAAGMQAVAYLSWGEDMNTDPADYVIKRHSELFGLPFFS